MRHQTIWLKVGAGFAGTPGDGEAAEGEEPKPKGRTKKDKDEKEKEEDPWENYGLNADGTEIVEELAPNEVSWSSPIPFACMPYAMSFDDGLAHVFGRAFFLSTVSFCSLSSWMTPAHLGWIADMSRLSWVASLTRDAWSSLDSFMAALFVSFPWLLSTARTSSQDSCIVPSHVCMRLS